jgi:hypothetical protein
MKIDYLKSDEYKKKYDDLMQRCAEFAKEFSPPTEFERGFKCGWEMAEKKFKDNNTYVPDTTKQPTQTIGFQYTSIPCPACGIDFSKTKNYVCMLSHCPSQIKASNINLGIHT